MPKINILGIKINKIDFNEVLSIIERFIQSGKPHQIVTVNPEMIMTAQSDFEFKRVLNKADLLVPDGIGIVWASRILGNGLRERVTGTDLVWKLAELANRKGYSIYFLGGKENVAKETFVRLKSRYKNLKLAGASSSSPSDIEIIDKIALTRPNILLVAFGHPRQEKWISKYKNRLGASVCIGVGGALDYISGKTQRAPIWIQKTGLEWFHRLVKEPWRISRQKSLPIFAWLIFKKRFGKQL